MDIIKQLIDFILHIDIFLNRWTTDYQTWTYLILFIIVFCETGLVVTPFLPGDSLLFASGAIAVTDGSPLSIGFLVLMFFSAALLGDNSNFFIGKFLGEKVYKKNYKLISRKNLDKTQKFYEKHGGKTLVIARFMPILRTFAPFVAGVARMTYPHFITYSLIGNVLWVNILCWAGYLFTNNIYVKNNFSVVIIVIILISVLPPLIVVLKEKFNKK